MYDPADDPTIIDPLHTANIGRQMRLDPSPLFVAQPKQILAHDPDPLPKRIRIVWNQDCLQHCEVVQPNEGLWVHSAARWRQGRVCTHHQN
jgi:hypothetical protein